MKINELDFEDKTLSEVSCLPYIVTEADEMSLIPGSVAEAMFSGKKILEEVDVGVANDLNTDVFHLSLL